MGGSCSRKEVAMEGEFIRPLGKRDALARDAKTRGCARLRIALTMISWAKTPLRPDAVLQQRVVVHFGNPNA